MYSLLKSQYKLLANFKCILFAFHFHLKTTNKTGVDRETRKDVARPGVAHQSNEKANQIFDITTCWTALGMETLATYLNENLYLFV